MSYPYTPVMDKVGNPTTVYVYLHRGMYLYFNWEKKLEYNCINTVTKSYVENFNYLR